ncbi:helix-turn-helix domain-containing protein [Shewanella waksmanii]|uniref:helix-turn-helix domain-containing protein n=1 Tax=Shewanella waksmanii TaxID=213783 RepID=UPI00373513EB
MTLGKRLKQCRTERNLSQPELAELAGIEQSYLSKLENDKSLPSNDVFRQLMTALAMTTSEFIRAIDTQKYRQQLMQISDIEIVINHRKQSQFIYLRRVLYLCALLIVAGVTVFYTGTSKQLFPQQQFQYQSLGVVLPGEPLDIFSSWSHRMAITTEKDRQLRSQKRLEMEQRRDVHYILTATNQSQQFVADDPQGKRLYILDKQVEVPQPINAWLQIIGVMLFISGVVGFGVERRLHKLITFNQSF